MDHRHSIWVLMNNGMISEFHLSETAVQDFATDYPDAIYFFARLIVPVMPNLEVDF